MPETEPVTVEIRADTGNLSAGLTEGKKALREFGDETDKVEGKQFKLVRQSTNLLGSVLAIRGAFSITNNLLEKFGLLSEQGARMMMSLETSIQIVVAALQIYRVISSFVTIQDLARAKAGFLAAIANVSAATLFIGTAAAIAGAIGAWAIITALTAPKAQFGGIVPPRSGGTPVIVGEAGEPEAIIPLHRARDYGFGGVGGNVNVTMNIQSNDPDYISRMLARRIQQVKMTGA